MNLSDIITIVGALVWFLAGVLAGRLSVIGTASPVENLFPALVLVIGTFILGVGIGTARNGR